jgi:hypothetical protein
MRKEQSGLRSFGPVTTAVWQAFRSKLRFEEGPEEDSRPIHELAAAFIRSNSVVSFYSRGDSIP